MLLDFNAVNDRSHPFALALAFLDQVGAGQCVVCHGRQKPSALLFGLHMCWVWHAALRRGGLHKLTGWPQRVSDELNFVVGDHEEATMEEGPMARELVAMFEADLATSGA